MALKNNAAMGKVLAIVFALILAFVAVDAFSAVNVADAAQNGSGAFGQVDVNGSKVTQSTDVESGIFDDMNFILYVFIGIGGIIVVMCIVFAGIKLATAQNNPQNRTQGFIGLGMALLGGWVIYKSLDLAGWIQGFGD